jgi:AcrR family transcriptional regulator
VGRPGRKEALLDAAIAVIRRDGARKLTLDAVAAEAGASKGGVLYHFNSKRDLIDGLVARWLDDFEAQLEDGDVAGTYVRASDLQAASPDLTASEFGLLAALIEDPLVLQSVRERHDAWMERMFAGGADRADVWLARLAADGLWYSDLLGIAPPQGEDRRRLMERLLALTKSPAR